MGEVSNRLSSSWQMRSDVSPPPVSLSFPRMTKKDHTSEASWSAILLLRPSHQIKPNWASMAWGSFASTTKVAASGAKPGNYPELSLFNLPEIILLGYWRQDKPGFLPPQE